MFIYLCLCVYFVVENPVLVIPVLTAIPCLVSLHLNLMNKSAKFPDLWLLTFSGRDGNNGIVVLQVLKCTSLSPQPLLEELRIGWFGFLWQFTLLFSHIFNIFGNFSFTFCLNLLALFVADIFFFLTALVLPLRVDLQNAVTSHCFKNFHNWTKLNLSSTSVWLPGFSLWLSKYWFHSFTQFDQNILSCYCVAGNLWNTQDVEMNKSWCLESNSLVGCCFCSVLKSCPTLCNPTHCSMLGFLVLHYLPGIAQTSCPLIQWCHPMISSSITPSPSALNLSQH